MARIVFLVLKIAKINNGKKENKDFMAQETNKSTGK
jgi:hypothetical protein